MNNQLCVTLHLSDATLLTLHVCIPVLKLASVPKRMIAVPLILNTYNITPRAGGEMPYSCYHPKQIALPSSPRWSQVLDPQHSLVGRASCRRWSLGLCSASFSWRRGHGSMAAHPR